MNTRIETFTPTPTNGHEVRSEYFDPAIQLCIDGALDAEADLDELKRNGDHLSPDYKTRKDELNHKKNTFIMGLIELRVQDPQSTIAVEISKVPHEQIHDLSQNRVIVYPHGYNDTSLGFVTYLDALAKVTPEKTSTSVLDMIGEPNVIEDDHPQRAIIRTFNEVKAAGRKINEAKAANNNRERRKYSSIKYDILTKRLLKLRRKTADGAKMIKVGFDPENEFYHFGCKDFKYHQRASASVTRLVESSGGHRFEEDFRECFN